MPHISELKDSKYLKKEDVGEGILVTIGDCEHVNVAMQGQPEELRWALHFDELDKPLILNSTNGQIIAAITGNDQTENWVGKKVVLYTDHNIQFQGRLVGGIRVRAPKGQAARAQAAARSQPPAQPAPKPPVPKPEQQEQESEEDSDSVPF